MTERSDQTSSNQTKNEPVGTSPETSAESSPSQSGQGPGRPAAGEGGNAMDGPVPTPGDAQGVSVPGVAAARGTSERSGAVSSTSNAVPGKPDGEVDTRPS